MEQNNCYLEEEKLFRLMLKFSIPCVLSMLVGALYNIIDQIFIGNSSVGTIGITATSVVFPMITIAMAFGLMLGDGATALSVAVHGKTRIRQDRQGDRLRHHDRFHEHARKIRRAEQIRRKRPAGDHRHGDEGLYHRSESGGRDLRRLPAHFRLQLWRGAV